MIYVDMFKRTCIIASCSTAANSNKGGNLLEESPTLWTWLRLEV